VKAARARTRPGALAAALLLLSLLLLPGCGSARTQPTVVWVGDGDSIRVRSDSQLIEVRLACIDAPEIAQTPHGEHSRRHLLQRLPVGSRVRLAEKAKDRYGRLVAEVFALDNVNINLAMVEDGQAFAYRRHLKQCAPQDYLAAEDRARWRGVGIWKVEGGINRPWTFRHQQGGGRR